MRILNRKQFLAMPSGTIYSRYEPIVSRDLEVKRDTLDNGDDWFYVSFIGSPECENEAGDVEAYEKMLTEDVPIEPYQIRDGAFEQDEMFLVYTEADVSVILGLIGEKK